MKLRYMVEYALRDRIRAPRFDPIGVWVQGDALALSRDARGHHRDRRTPLGGGMRQVRARPAFHAKD